MRRLAFSLLGLAVLSAPPAEVRAQRSEYPLILVPTAKGSFTFPPGYHIPDSTLLYVMGSIVTVGKPRPHFPLLARDLSFPKFSALLRHHSLRVDGYV